MLIGIAYFQNRSTTAPAEASRIVRQAQLDGTPLEGLAVKEARSRAVVEYQLNFTWSLADMQRMYYRQLVDQRDVLSATLALIAAIH